MDADTRHAEASASGARRQRLTPDARKLLKDFAEQVTIYPDSHQRQELHAQVLHLPGCAHVDSKHILSWFQRHRTATRKKAVPDDDGILFSNFTSNQLEVLRTLLRNNPAPKKEMISIWATCIKAEVENVRMWVSYQQAKVAPQEVSEQCISASPTVPHPHLPTPARSISPPPVRGMSLPLIATKEEPSPPGTPLLVTLPTHAHTAHAPHTTLSRHAAGDAYELDELHPLFTQIPSNEGSKPQFCISGTKPSLKVQLAADMNDIMASRHPAHHLPSTQGEFDAMFKPYEDMITQFMCNVESGRLQHLGLEPSLCKTTEI